MTYNSRITPRLARLTIGSRLEFVCKGDDAVFFYNRLPIPAGLVFLPQTSTLLLESVTYEDAGDYYCFVTDQNNNHFVAKAAFVILGNYNL